MSIRWIRNVVVDGRKATLEVMLGFNKLADKCYVRVDDERECWFTPVSDNREAILDEGLRILRQRFSGHSVRDPSGSDFTWH